MSFNCIMGISQFHHFLDKRYPSFTRVVDKYMMPKIDCFYLDMNNIICAVKESVKSTNVTEEEAITDIYERMDYIVKLVKPKEYLYIAVDGIVPLAKKTQHKYRQHQLKENAGLNLKPVNDDSANGPFFISHGSRFMDCVQTALENFVVHKINEDPFWKTFKVILSGNRVPGEGEHKIAEFLRYRRTVEHYNPNTTHCFYGHDADMIVIALACHEPNIFIMRDELVESKKKRQYTFEDLRFSMSSIAVLRKYIELEFDCLKSKLGYKFDLESLIDDWIFMTYFLGNDFLPPPPGCNNPFTTLPALWNTYKGVRPQLRQYINHRGLLDVVSLIQFAQAARFMDEDYVSYQYKGKLQRYSKSFHEHKQLYYENQFKDYVTSEELNHFVTQYVEILQWINFYYFYGTPSLQDYHPHKNAPYLSDLTQIDAAYIKDGFTFHYEFQEPELPQSDAGILLYEYDMFIEKLHPDVFRLPFKEIMPGLLPYASSSVEKVKPICPDHPGRSRTKSSGCRQRLASGISRDANGKIIEKKYFSDINGDINDIKFLKISEEHYYDLTSEEERRTKNSRIRNNSNSLKRHHRTGSNKENISHKSALWNKFKEK